MPACTLLSFACEAGGEPIQNSLHGMGQSGTTGRLCSRGGELIDNGRLPHGETTESQADSPREQLDDTLSHLLNNRRGSCA